MQLSSACHKIGNYLNLRLIRRFRVAKILVVRIRSNSHRHSSRDQDHENGRAGTISTWATGRTSSSTPSRATTFRRFCGAFSTFTGTKRLEPSSSRCAHICPGVDRSVGRPGMNMWKILVLGISRFGVRPPSRTCEPAQDGSPGTWRFCGRCLLRVSDGY